MATLNFSFDTGAVPISRIIDAVCLEYNYPTTVPDPTSTPETPKPFIANPESKASFAKNMIGRVLRNIVKNQELKIAVSTAESSISLIDLN